MSKRLPPTRPDDPLRLGPPTVADAVRPLRRQVAMESTRGCNLAEVRLSLYDGGMCVGPKRALPAQRALLVRSGDHGIRHLSQSGR
jgi:hypothetical protein